MANPKLSIVIPIHDMPNGDFFLWRTVQALMSQTFKDFEIVITQEGKMAKNTNAGIKKAKGELVKILYLDDYLAHKDSLKEIVKNFGKDDQWLVTGCVHQKNDSDYYEDPHSPHFPSYSEDIHRGNNTIGSPSVLTFRNEGRLLFDENMSWLLDADLYKRYYAKYGQPKILNDLNVCIGIGEHQTTYKLTDEEKSSEYYYLSEKYAN